MALATQTHELCAMHASSPDEPIAIVGLALKFPGEGVSPESFWQMLCERRNTMAEFPQDRFNTNAFHSQEGGSSTFPFRGGHFLKESLEVFDAPFFSITPDEAAAMDPQHRILLETTYHALENAGIPLTECSRSKASVFTATFTDDYRSILLANPDRLPKYAATGLSSAMLANRISWFFDFKGPSMNLDSACSSSLSALHLACQDLLHGSSNMSIVGGCNLVFHPDILLTMANMSFLSKDSRCWSFDHRANGYARGEGFGVLILKRLSNALNEGLSIRAVIRATGLNQDGKTEGGITQPSRKAQKALIYDTFARSNLDMSTVRFFEAHGTGTPIGDPIEASAIGECFQQYRSEEEPLIVGAVKSNIGHLEGGSGVAGVIKTIFILEKGLIPPNTGFEKINPKINTRRLRIKFPTEIMKWPSTGLRRACVNSFGFGGSNAFVILDDAQNFLKNRAPPDYLPPPTWSPRCNSGNAIFPDDHIASEFDQLSSSTPPQHVRQCLVTNHRALYSSLTVRPKLLAWSGSDELSVKNIIQQYHSFFRSRKEGVSELEFDQIVYTLCARRSLLAWRTYAVMTCTGLGALDQEYSKPTRPSKNPMSTAFVFAGQGAQYPGMGAGLSIFPAFRESIDDSERILGDLGCQWSMHKLLNEQDPRIHMPEFSQACTTALQIAIIDLVKSFGITPRAVVGHSSGEIAAAYCAGLLNKKTALTAAYYRGVLAAGVPKSYTESLGMLAVGLSAESLRPFLDRLKAQVPIMRVQIGCFNSPQSITLTGDHGQLKLLEMWLKESGSLARMLRVNVAYHSEFMTSIRSAYLKVLRPLDWSPSAPFQLPMISSVTGNIVPSYIVRDPVYWCENLCGQVKFHKAMAFLSSNSGQTTPKQLGSQPQSLSAITSLLEIGPHATLQGPISDILAESGMHAKLLYLSTLNRYNIAEKSILDAVGRMWASGYPVDLGQVNGLEKDARIVRTDLPAYPFNHSHRYWFEDRASAAFRFRQNAPHELLGSWIPTSGKLEARWRSFVSSEKLLWTRDHQINGNCLLPGAGMIGMAIEGARQLGPSDLQIRQAELRSIEFKTALQLPGNGDDVEIQMSLSRENSRDIDPWYTFKIFSFGLECTEHCCGRICLSFTHAEDDNSQISLAATDLAYLDKLSSISATCGSKTESEALYESIRENGVNYGACFQTLNDIRYHSKGAAMANISLSNLSNKHGSSSLDLQAYIMHPSLLDGFFQLVFPALNEGGYKTLPSMVPSYVRRLVIRPDEQMQSSQQYLCAGATAAFDGYRGAECNIVASSHDNYLRLVMEGYQTTFVSATSTHSSTNTTERPLLSYMKWLPDLSAMTVDQCAKYIRQGMASAELSKSFYEDVSRLIHHYISRSLKALPQYSGSIASSPIKRDVEWMKQEFPLIENDNQSSVQLLDNGQLPVSKETFSILEEQVTATSGIGEFYVKLGSCLSSVIGARTNLDSSILFSELVDAHFCHCQNSLGLSKPLQNWLTLATHKDPSLRILEIGSSYRATFKPAVNIVATNGLHLHHYEYSVATPEILARTQLLFRDLGVAPTGHLFDFEKNTDLQSFQESPYDVIIALYLLGEPARSTETLRNVKKLLKPGGKVILFGSATLQLRMRFMHTVFSAQANKSSASDSSLPSSDTSRAHVQHMLLENGFSGIDIEIQDSEDKLFHETSLYISTSLEPTEAQDTPFPPTTILIKKDSWHQLSLAKVLKEEFMASEGSQVDICEVRAGTFEGAFCRRFCVSLLEYEDCFFYDMSSYNFDLLKTLLNKTKDILWVVKDAAELLAPNIHVVDGLSRVLRSEDVKLRFSRLTLGPNSSTLATIRQAMKSMVKSPLHNLEPECELRNDTVYINRVIQSTSMNSLVASKLSPCKEVEVRLHRELPMVITLQTPGVLNSIVFEKTTSHEESCSPDEIIVDVRAIGLSIRDYQIASGQLNDTRMFSGYSGKIVAAGSQTQFSPGDRVIVHQAGSCRTILKCKASFAVKIAPSCDLLGAAAWSTPALIALHALVNLSKLKKGETILIHHAAKATGQMAIQVAQYLGASIVVTASTNEEFHMLHRRYSLATERILPANGSGSRQPILRATNNNGLDVVLNFETRDEFESSIELMAPFGRLIDTGVNYRTSTKALGPEASSRCIAYYTVDLFQMQLHCPSLLQSLLTQLSSWLRDDKIGPTSLVETFGADGIPEALQRFSYGEPTMPVVIDLRPDQAVKAQVPNEPSYQFKEDATYVISGGFGGLGRSVIRWMVRRGARHLLVLSRSGSANSSSQELIQELISLGIEIQAPPCDISSAVALKGVLDSCSTTMPPIRGCIQSTMVLRDAIFTNMTYDDFIASTRPKVQGSWNLHYLLPKGMDFFIAFASVGGILGASSQGNYAAGNTFEDALARYRVVRGEKAVSIDLGMMVSEGIVAETAGMLESLKRLGYLMEITQVEFHALLDYYCDPALPVLAPDEAQIIVGIEHPAAIEAKGYDVPEWMNRPLFRHFQHLGRNPGAEPSSAGAKKQNVEAVLRQAASTQEAAEQIAEWLVAKLSQVLGVPAEDIDRQTPIRTNGLNSLAAVEMKTWFDRKIGAEVAVFEILGNTSLMNLCKRAAEKSRFR